MDKKIKSDLAAYRRYLENLKTMEETSAKGESSKGTVIKGGPVKTLGTHPLLGTSSKTLFKNDEKGYLSAFLLALLTFMFQLSFLLLSYFMFS